MSGDLCPHCAFTPAKSRCAFEGELQGQNCALIGKKIDELRKTVINLGFLLWAYRRLRREMLQQYVATLETRRQKAAISG